jgi:hypothetical protein
MARNVEVDNLLCCEWIIRLRQLIAQRAAPAATGRSAAREIGPPAIASGARQSQLAALESFGVRVAPRRHGSITGFSDGAELDGNGPLIETHQKYMSTALELIGRSQFDPLQTLAGVWGCKRERHNPSPR